MHEEGDAPISARAGFGGRALARFGTSLAILATGISLLPSELSAAQPPTPKNVLVLYSFSDRNIYDPVDLLEAGIRARVQSPVNLYVEFMENQRFENAAYQKTLAETLRNTYGGTRLDLVIPVNYPALHFVVQYRDRMFPGVPIVFSEVHPSRISGQKLWPGVTGVTVEGDIAGTINLVLRLHPDTRTIAVVTGNSEFERYWLGRVHSELLRYHDRASEVDLVGSPGPEVIRQVDALPSHTVVLFQITPQESVHAAVGVYDIAALIGRRRPTYCIFSVLCVNHGGIGGSYPDKREQTELLARVAGRVLSGERPEDVPVEHGSATQMSIDWRQIQRWHIPESALPPGSLVLNREPTFWERDRKYVIAAFVLIVAQSLVILGLLWQRARKRKAEAVLQESEKRFRVMAETTPSLIWMCDKEGKITYLNSRRLEFTGPDPNAGYGDTWKKYLHPDDLKDILPVVRQALKTPASYSNQYRLRRYDGVYRWMLDVATPRVNGDGSFAGFIGLAVDVTEQKLAQEGLENLSGRLIEAQEKERSRIARDLHDDICQRLALVSVELAQATCNGFPPAMKERLEEMRQQCSDIAGDLQSLSHQLHSSKLDYLGVVAAIKGLCREFGKQHNVNITLRDENVPTHMSKDISLCLFRVTQEALQNALKYSGTNRFAVAMRGSAHEVQLEVKDDGAGFGMNEAKRSPGLGLVSMQERVHLVHGRLHIDSKPGEGTRIVVTVPVIAVESGTDARGDGATNAQGAA